MTARVLVVDDILANVKLLEARLNAEYFEVLTARSGEEALGVVRSSPVDVVLLDVMMPGMDGFEVCRQIKSVAATAQLPIVMVTALDQAADKVRGLEAGADDFLTKPVDDIALITRVKNLARLKALSDEMLLRMTTNADFKPLPNAEIAGMPADAAGRILLVEDQPRHGRHHGAAGAFDHARDHELRQRLRQRAADRAQHEHRDRGAEHGAGAEAVGGPAAHGDDHSQ